MGPTLHNLDKLLRLPFGCGEQNMIHFAPNVFVLKYLQKTRQLSPEVENEATDYLLQGKETESWQIASLDQIFSIFFSSQVKYDLLAKTSSDGLFRIIFSCPNVLELPSEYLR